MRALGFWLTSEQVPVPLLKLLQALGGGAQPEVRHDAGDAVQQQRVHARVQQVLRGGAVVPAAVEGRRDVATKLVLLHEGGPLMSVGVQEERIGRKKRVKARDKGKDRGKVATRLVLCRRRLNLK